MAKGKRSVALFEVIQSSRTSRGGISLRTPKWWFKRRNVDGSTPATATPPAPATAEPGTTAPAPRAPGVDLNIDPDRQRITFHVSYTSAIVTAFTVLVIVGLAYMIGQHMRGGPSPALAGSNVPVAQRPVNASVLDIKPSAPGTKRPNTPAAAADPEVASQTAPAASVPPATTSPSGQRIIGLNYVVVQGWPPEEKAMAQEALDFLNKNGVPCSIETNIAGYHSNWFFVVGLTGFQRPVSDPKYDRYVTTIRDLSDKFAKNSKFKRFDPTAKKWGS